MQEEEEEDAARKNLCVNSFISAKDTHSVHTCIYILSSVGPSLLRRLHTPNQQDLLLLLVSKSERFIYTRYILSVGCPEATYTNHLHYTRLYRTISP